MSPLRILFGALATVLIIATLIVALRDVRIDGANCGSALLRKDPLETRLLTGDLGEDAFQEQRISSTCDREIAKRRFAVAVPAAAAVGCIVAGRRLRDRSEETGSDSTNWL